MNDLFCPCCKQPMDLIGSAWVTIKAEFDGKLHEYKLCSMCSLNIVTDYLPDIEAKIMDDIMKDFDL